MKRLRVLTYERVDNPLGIPSQWPAIVEEVGQNDLVMFPWVVMTVSSYSAYRNEWQAEYDAWFYNNKLKNLKASCIEKLWQSCYDYNFQFFSGGAYAMMLGLKMMGSIKAAENEQWVLNLWGLYYQRKDIVVTALTIETVMGVSIDFELLGNPPWTVQQMMS